MTRHVSAIVLVALTLFSSSAGRAQSPAGAVLLPPNAYRPPVALIVAAPDSGTTIANSLAHEGLASTNVTPGSDGTDEIRIRRLTDALMTLRNDARFPTVIVIGQGPFAADAAVAARLARVDGFVAASAPADSEPISRLIVEVFKTNDALAAAKEIADYARNLPALGRRGTSERRPLTSRLSPRTLALGTVNGSLVGIEYGSPQKRGREIWGALVPSNREWMPGADETTTMTTSVEMKVGDVTVPAGDHTFYFMLREDGSRLLISRDVGQFHTAPVIRSMVLGTVDMTLAHRTDRLEGLTFTIEPRADGGVLKIGWDDREYIAQLTVQR